MNAERWGRINDLFQAALSQPIAERGGLLAHRCGDDSALRGEVEGLLAAHDCASAFIELPAFELSQRRPAEAAAIFSPGQRLGQYTVRGVLGVGGMGVVYEADQEHPWRTVALKVIRPGFATPGLLRRFDHEANILARLQHPGIAQVFDAAAADSPFGRLPFFAMERVAGESITAFADMRGLSIAARVELLAGVCDAVQHAHQKGVIHRDLKPSNILVTAEGQAKVLDFGVARVADPAVAPVTIQTEIGQIVGTFAYMSPEQVSGDRDAIDTRSDVYSLGVIGYELLTGRLPFDLAGKNLVEAARIIRDVPPPRPASLRPDLGSDLDIILRHALEKSPARRYPSAAELAADLRRVLDRRPILARPPSVSYQFRKWITRNRVVFTLGSALLVLIVGSAITTGWLALRFAQERDAALSAKTRESEERDTAEQTAAFLAKLFEQANPYNQKTAAETTSRELLDAGVQRLETELADKPLVRARLMTVIGRVYATLADYPKSLGLLQPAVEIVRRERGNDHPDLIEPLNALADALSRSGAWNEGQRALLEQLRICEAHFGPRHERVAESLTNVGSGHFYAGEFDAALDYFQRSLALRAELFGEASPQFASELNNVGFALQNLNRLDEAEAILDKGLNLKLQRGGDPVGVGQSLEALAHLAYKRKDLAAAEDYLTRQVALYRQAYHDEYPQIAFALNNLAYITAAHRGSAAAEPIYREVLERRRRLFGENHPDYAWTLGDLGVNQMEQGKYDEAVVFHTQALDIRRRLWGNRNSQVAASLQSLGETYRRAGRVAEAELLLLESYEIVVELHGEITHRAIPSVVSLSRLYRDLDQAEVTAFWLEILGHCHLSANFCIEAAEAYREALEINERLFGPDDERSIASRAQLLTTE